MDYPWARMANLIVLGREQPIKPIDQLLSEIEGEVEAGRFDKAIDLLESAVDRAEPTHHLTLKQALAWIHLQAAQSGAGVDGAKDDRGVLRHLERARRLIAENPNMVESAPKFVARIEAILSLFRSEFKKALRSYPVECPAFLTYPRWLVERSLIALVAGRPAAVRDDLEAYFAREGDGSMEPDDLKALADECYAACIWAEGDWDRVISCLTRALDAGRPTAARALAYAHYKRGVELADSRPQEAVEHWEAACAIDPNSKTARAAALRIGVLHAGQAMAAWRRNDLAQAARAWAKSLEIDPESPTARLGLALVHFRRREWERARAEAEKAMGRAPSEAALGPRLVRMAALVMLADVKEARDEARRLSAEKPGDVELEALWGLLSVASGRLQDGYRILSVLAQDTVHPLALYGAALCAQAKGNRKGFQRLVEEYAKVRGESYPPLPSEAEDSIDQFALAMAQRIVQEAFQKALGPADSAASCKEPPEPEYGRAFLPELRWWAAPLPRFAPLG